MAINQNGIAISLKAFVPMGKTIDEQLEVLMLVKQCHETGNYAPLLERAIVDAVKAEQKTRRVEDPVEQAQGEATEATAADVSAEQSPDFAEVEVISDAAPATDTADPFWSEPEAAPAPKSRRR